MPAVTADMDLHRAGIFEGAGAGLEPDHYGIAAVGLGGTPFHGGGNRRGVGRDHHRPVGATVVVNDSRSGGGGVIEVDPGIGRAGGDGVGREPGAAARGTHHLI